MFFEQMKIIYIVLNLAKVKYADDLKHNFAVVKEDLDP